MALRESILDFPKETLNPSIWTKLEDGSYSLRDDVRQTIQAIVDWAIATFKIPDANVNIVGSNASNSYSSSSDIDIHFNSPKFKKDKADEFNKLFRKKFEDLTSKMPELGHANGIKTEIYMQPNPFQDLMSVGCYDFFNRRWLVGPDLKDMSFDPYAEYFSKDMKSIDDVIDGIRSIILQMYELSIAVLKSKDQQFIDSIGKKLCGTMKKASMLFKALKKRRSIESAPSSEDEAMKHRNSQKWKTSDSAFKLLDKFGYLKILQQAAKSIDNEDSPVDAAQHIMQLVTDKISTSSLDDSEKEFVGKLLEVEQCNESIGSMVKLSTIAALMSIGTFVPVDALAQELSKARKDAVATNQPFTKDSPLVKKAIGNSAKENAMVGKMNKVNTVNAIAQVLWKEARGIKEGTAGRKAVASVILNRTGNDPSYIVDVIKQKHAFSCMKKYTGGWTDDTYKFFVPASEISGNASNKEIWDECNSIALLLVEKKFKSTIGNMNSYLNKTTADKDAVDTWGKKCKLKIGSHHFGYLPEHDPKIVVPGTMTTWKQASKNGKFVVVKNGETLSKIAKDNSTTVSKILAMNQSVKDPNKISIGQKIRVA